MIHVSNKAEKNSFTLFLTTQAADSNILHHTVNMCLHRNRTNLMSHLFYRPTFYFYLFKLGDVSKVSNSFSFCNVFLTEYNLICMKSNFYYNYFI